MFVDDAGVLELLVEAFGLEHFLEQILEAAVIGLEDRVLGRQVDRPFEVQAIVERGAREVADRIVQIVHRHGDARTGEVEHFAVDRLTIFALED